EESPTALEIQLLEDNGLKTETLYRAVGCEKCGGSGFTGRLVIAESFVASEELEDLITAMAGTMEIQQFLNSKGMVKLHKDGLIKAMQGLTTIKEVEKAVLL
ncbi:MAG: type II/IV secretion system protein, partial [Spirochaetaceae bacterium]|nr:type II/IV secretion system protein [Spirochaetaceae bacterium]